MVIVVNIIGMNKFNQLKKVISRWLYADQNELRSPYRVTSVGLTIVTNNVTKILSKYSKDFLINPIDLAVTSTV